jgi:hypothetical protein
MHGESVRIGSLGSIYLHQFPDAADVVSDTRSVKRVRDFSIKFRHWNGGLTMCKNLTKLKQEGKLDFANTPEEVMSDSFQVDKH